MTAALVMLAGLPGAGKSHLADRLRTALDAFVLSVDPIENALYRAGISRSEPAGLAAYVVAEALAEPALRAGQSVLIDAVNDDPRARSEWRELARRTHARWRPIEVVCSDPGRHRRQLEGRTRGLDGIPEPDWTGLEGRRAGLAAWVEPRLVLDVADDRADVADDRTDAADDRADAVDGRADGVDGWWAAAVDYVRSGDAGGTAPAPR